ncbi:MAG: hypothetical protein R2724_28690 [Bryobacterales bacterium]
MTISVRAYEDLQAWARAPPPRRVENQEDFEQALASRALGSTETELETIEGPERSRFG